MFLLHPQIICIDLTNPVWLSPMDALLHIAVDNMPNYPIMVTGHEGLANVLNYNVSYLYLCSFFYILTVISVYT